MLRPFHYARQQITLAHGIYFFIPLNIIKPAAADARRQAPLLGGFSQLPVDKHHVFGIEIFPVQILAGFYVLRL